MWHIHQKNKIMLRDEHLRMLSSISQSEIFGTYYLLRSGGSGFSGPFDTGFVSAIAMPVVFCHVAIEEVPYMPMSSIKLAGIDCLLLPWLSRKFISLEISF